MNSANTSARSVLLSWSSGKDSAWCLHVLRQRADIDIVGLLTTFDGDADRVAMHAVRRELAMHRAVAVGLPLIAVDLPWPCPNAVYERSLAEALSDAREQFDVSTIAFGDLFLEDIRAYRDRQLAEWGFEGLYPIWQEPTASLAKQMIDGGLRAVITCVDPKQCPSALAGREFDQTLLDDLPPGVDPCGENGEFHTFAFDSPDFDHPIEVEVGSRTERDGFAFADVLPAGSTG